MAINKVINVNIHILHTPFPKIEYKSFLPILKPKSFNIVFSCHNYPNYESKSKHGNPYFWVPVENLSSI